MPDFSHLDAIYRRASHEKARLAAATKPADVALRTVWVAQVERERIAELRFLGLERDPRMSDLDDEDGLTVAELLAELMA
jgi:hypothetical protein